MSQGLPYLSEDAIERDAAQLLAEFAQARRLTLAPPIPIEDVIEKHLRLRIDFDDLHALHSVPRPASGETAILGRDLRGRQDLCRREPGSRGASLPIERSL